MAHATRITRPRLTAVSFAGNYRLNVGFIDGSNGTVDLKPSVFSLPGLVPLRDPAAFAGAVLGEYGWEAEWPEFDIQIGADTLFAEMLDQSAKSPADRSNKAPLITAVEVTGTLHLVITWSTGEVLECDLAATISNHAAFASLADPAVFSQAAVEEWGHGLDWPGGLDIGADRLYQLCREQDGAVGLRRDT